MGTPFFLFCRLAVASGELLAFLALPPLRAFAIGPLPGRLPI